jgi:hypothetical protein
VRELIWSSGISCFASCKLQLKFDTQCDCVLWSEVGVVIWIFIGCLLCRHAAQSAVVIRNVGSTTVLTSVNTETSSQEVALPLLQTSATFAESSRTTPPSCSSAGGHSYGNSAILSIVILILSLTVCVCVCVCFFLRGGGSAGRFVFYAGSRVLIERKNY